MVYTASCSALAILEGLVHMRVPHKESVVKPPKNLLLITIEVPDTLDCERVRQVPVNPKMSQQLGDEWLEAGTSPVLSVPSVIAPLQQNCLLNPSHSLFRAIRISNREPFVLDFRLTELLAEELGAS